MRTNPKDYTDLRTLLDSLEIGALRYFLGQKGSQSDKLRYLQDKLKPIADELWGQGAPSIDCPPGYYSCDGMCVPYPCPDLSNTIATASAQTAKKKR
jgi:hypothetical protein